MPHKNIYLQNENLWEEVKKQAFIENKTCSGFIEEILTLSVSQRKERALTPEKIGIYIKNNYVKGDKITDITISLSACGDVWISKRKLKVIMEDLCLNGILREIRNPKKGSKVRLYEVV